MSPKLRALGKLWLTTLAICGALVASFAFIQSSHSYQWLLPFAIGASLSTYGFFSLRRASAIKRWTVVPATIIEASIGEIYVPGRAGGYTEYFPQVRFQYESPSGSRESAHFSIAADDYRDVNRSRAEQILKQIPVGAAKEAFMCPENPELAVLDSKVSADRLSHYWACLVGGALVVGVSLWLRNLG